MTYTVTPVPSIAYEDVYANGKTTRVKTEQTDEYLLARIKPGDTVIYKYPDRSSTFNYQQFVAMMEEAGVTVKGKA
jgi:spore coat protein CotH